ncbi:MAG: hemerythrin-like metal-binding protein [Rhodocyclaceae bacterium]|nr:hemerythrin-like metal-binding protein [Rhodocyclaceae bacterium]
MTIMTAVDLFNWSDSYNVGIGEVDEQHQVLVALLNQLHEAIREHRGKAASREILDRLADYTGTHFQLEESLMRRTRYPGFEIHRQQHEDLIQQVQDLQYKLDQENAAITFELLHFLKNWLTQHINDSDKRFGAFFQTASLDEYVAWSEEVQSTLKKKWWRRLW